MTFDDWWKQMKPAECDELKAVFVECWTHARQEALEEAAKVCTDHIAWLRQYDAEKMRTAATLLDAIRALPAAPQEEDEAMSEQKLREAPE